MIIFSSSYCCTHDLDKQARNADYIQYGFVFRRNNNVFLYKTPQKKYWYKQILSISSETPSVLPVVCSSTCLDYIYRRKRAGWRYSCAHKKRTKGQETPSTDAFMWYVWTRDGCLVMTTTWMKIYIIHAWYIYTKYIQVYKKRRFDKNMFKCRKYNTRRLFSSTTTG